MMNASELQLRKHIEKTVVLSDDEYIAIKGHFRMQSFEKHQHIIQEGEAVPDLYFILSGLVKLVFSDRQANHHIVSFAMEDWWETDFEAYFAEKTATLSLQSIERTVVYGLSLKSFHQLCQQSGKMQSFFLQKSIGGHIGSQRRILSFLTSNAKERFEQLQRTSPSLIQRVPKGMLASYMGVSRETLSRFSR